MLIAVVLIALAALAVAFVIAGASVRVLREYERGVVFRLGRVIEQKGPGLVTLIPAWTAWCASASARSRCASRPRS